MKKLFVILIMLVYGLSSSGMSLSLHFCCGKLDDISVSSSKDKHCAKDLESKKDGKKDYDSFSKKRCCDSKHLEFKLKADQEPAAKWVQAYKQLTSPVFTITLYNLWQPQHKPVNELATGPPLALTTLPLFIKNRVFRI